MLQSLKNLFFDTKVATNEHMRPDDENVQWIRIGGYIHSTSEETLPPPITSVAHRDEWILCKILET